MARELNNEQIKFVKENFSKMSAEEMCVGMKGIGPKTVKKYLETEGLTTVTKKEGRAGRLMARDPGRGVTVMTMEASEASDKIRKGGSAPVPNNRIHIIKKED